MAFMLKDLSAMPAFTFAFGLLLLSFDTIKTYLLILIEIYDYGVGIRND